MPSAASLLAPLLAASNELSELTPFLIVMIAGFLVGAWGQASRSAIAVIAGMLLILFAIAGFLLANSSGPVPDVLS